MAGPGVRDEQLPDLPHYTPRAVGPRAGQRRGVVHAARRPMVMLRLRPHLPADLHRVPLPASYLTTPHPPHSTPYTPNLAPPNPTRTNPWFLLFMLGAFVLIVEWIIPFIIQVVWSILTWPLRRLRKATGIGRPRSPRHAAPRRATLRHAASRHATPLHLASLLPMHTPSGSARPQPPPPPPPRAPSDSAERRATSSECAGAQAPRSAREAAAPIRGAADVEAEDTEGSEDALLLCVIGYGPCLQHGSRAAFGRWKQQRCRQRWRCL